MSNLYFTYSPLTANTVARAADVNARFSGIEAGFTLLPPPVYLYEDRITYSTDTGTADAYVATPAIPITAYSEGLRIRLKAANANTGVSTVDVSGLGVKQIVRADGSALQLGDILGGQILDLTYDGSQFRLGLAFAELSPAGVMAKIAAGGPMVVNGSVTTTALVNNGQTLDGLSAFGVSMAESASAASARTLLGLGDVVTHNFSEFLSSGALASYAPLASPVFTGVPIAPTAVAGTNTTQLATTAFVTAAVGGVSGFAPINSPTFTGTPAAPTPATADNTTKLATTAYVQSNLTAYAPLASPAFSGAPTVPTAAPGTNTTQIASTAYVTAAVAAGGGGPYAPLASPAFTGVPTAPTASVNTNTTQIATTAFVQTNTNGLAPLASPTFTGTPSAPTPLTANNSTTLATTAYVQNNLTGLAPLASPALTGSPTAPTQAAGNNTTRIATTAYVQGELGGFAPAFTPVTNFTAAKTMADADNGGYFRFTGTTTRTVTLNSTPTAGFAAIIANRGTVAITLSAASGAYLNGAGGTATSISLATSGKVTIFHEGSGIWTVDGTGAS
jgi:hypothetical protein